MASAGALLLVACAVSAADGFQPKPGMPGKDVVWIPTPDHVVDRMLDLARVTARDTVIDLGSGDGRMVIAAAKRGAQALGVEFNADLVDLSRRAAAAAGMGERARFVQGDMFAADISQATVLPLFLLPDHLAKLAPKFLALRPGARIVSNTYEIGGGWEPDARVTAQPCASWCIAVLYVVPAQVAGTWRLADGTLLTLEQRYQQISGTLEIAGIALPVEAGRLRGAEIGFTVNRVAYAGRVSGDTMHGVARGRTTRDWSAAREQH